MHASDQRVFGDDEIAARRRRKARHVVLKPQRAGAGDGCKKISDEIVFGDALHDAYLPNGPGD